MRNWGYVVLFLVALTASLTLAAIMGATPASVAASLTAQNTPQQERELSLKIDEIEHLKSKILQIHVATRVTPDCEQGLKTVRKIAGDTLGLPEEK